MARTDDAAGAAANGGVCPESAAAGQPSKNSRQAGLQARDHDNRAWCTTHTGWFRHLHRRFERLTRGVVFHGQEGAA